MDDVEIERRYGSTLDDRSNPSHEDEAHAMAAQRVEEGREVTEWPRHGEAL